MATSASALFGLLALAALAPRLRADEPPPPPKEALFFESYDKNADGKVTQEEFGGDPAAFVLLDRNRDGSVCPDELGLPADYKPAPRPAGEPAPSATPTSPAPPAGRPGAEQMRKRLREMDLDGDKRVSREEWKGQPEGFARYDRNHDGFVDEADMSSGAGARTGTGTDAEPMRKRWATWDLDHDGRVSREEYKGELRFERLDVDRDGFLTEADLKRLAEAPSSERVPMVSTEESERRFATLDSNHNGRIEAAEMPEAARERMLLADEDADGALSADEFRRGARRLPPPPEGAPGSPAAARPEGGLELLKRFDHDRDGVVLREQFPGTEEQFAKLDKDGDGTLTQKDFPAPPPVAAPAAAPTFASADKDADGRLSRAEFHGSDDEWRARDANTDGWLTPGEWAAPTSPR